MLDDLTKEVSHALNNADGIVIYAGAGMGVDAGIPDFRGASGVWTAEKDTFIKFANGRAFHDRPLEAWNFYIQRLIKYTEFEPHRGYYELQKLKADMFVVTSNVDGHFKKSGWPKNRIFEIHGNLEWIQCSHRCCRDIYSMPKFSDTANNIDELPHCTKCGKIMRPVIMMFNDPWFETQVADIQSTLFHTWLLMKDNVVGIEIGAGLAVPSIRMMGNEQTTKLIRINPHDYHINRSQDISIPETAVVGIDLLFKILDQ